MVKRPEDPSGDRTRLNARARQMSVTEHNIPTIWRALQDRVGGYVCVNTYITSPRFMTKL